MAATSVAALAKALLSAHAELSAFYLMNLSTPERRAMTEQTVPSSILKFATLVNSAADLSNSLYVMLRNQASYAGYAEQLEQGFPKAEVSKYLTLSPLDGGRYATEAILRHSNTQFSYILDGKNPDDAPSLQSAYSALLEAKGLPVPQATGQMGGFPLVWVAAGAVFLILAYLAKKYIDVEDKAIENERIKIIEETKQLEIVNNSTEAKIKLIIEFAVKQAAECIKHGGDALDCTKAALKALDQVDRALVSGAEIQEHILKNAGDRANDFEFLGLGWKGWATIGVGAATVGGYVLYKKRSDA